MTRKTISRIAALHAGTAILLCTSPVLAQQAVSDANDGNQSAATEIVVTATKREQKLQDVGISIAVLSGEQLTRNQINNVADLALFTPGLNFSQSPEAKPVYTIRGVGFYDASLAAYPDVASYIDQAPLALPIMSALTAFDLERVEILKGPQGTLFGNNATGGAINFVAAKPTNTLRAGASIGYARFDTFDLNAFVSGPLTDTLAMRVAVKGRKGSGWQESYTRDAKNGKVNELAGRILLAWKPTDTLSVNLNLNGWRNKSQPQAPQAQSIELQNPIGTCGFGNCITPDMPLLNIPLPDHKPRLADWNPDHQPYLDAKFYQAVGRVDYDITSDIQLVSITSYADIRYKAGTESDGTYLEDLDIYQNPGDAWSFNQELRIEGKAANSAVRWVIGGNYERTNASETFFQHYKDGSSGYQQGFTANTAISDQRMRNYAGFANVEVSAIDRIVLKGGVRYTEASRKAALRTTGVPGYVEPPAAPGFANVGIEDFFNYVWPNAYLPVQCPGATYQPVPPGGSISIDPATCRTGTFFGKLKENNTSWSTGIDFKIDRDKLLYASVSKGYKAGSMPTVNAATWDQYRAVRQESLVSYEVGAKTSFAQGLVTLNAAAFYYDYKNKQLRAKVVDPIFGPLDALVNVPKSKIKGAEFDLTIRPVSGLQIAASATYLDAKVKTYQGVIGSEIVDGLRQPILSDFSGVTLPFSPKWQGTASINYEFDVGEGSRVSFGTSVNAQTRSYGTLALTDIDKSKFAMNGRALFNLNAGYAWDDNRWRVDLWGKNIFNKYYSLNSTLAYDTVVRYTGRPSEYGITLSWKM